MHTINNKGILLSIFLIIALFCHASVPSEANFIRLEKTFKLNSDGSQEFRCNKILKIHSHPAVNSTYGETFIVYNPAYQKLIIHSSYTKMVDGTIVKTPDNAFNEVLPRYASGATAYNNLKEMVVTHTGLELGATIYLDYSIITNSDRNQQLDIKEILQESSPVDECKITIIAPKDKHLSYQLTGLSSLKTIQKNHIEGDQKIFSCQLSNIPAASQELYQPENNPMTPTLWLSGYPSFKDALSNIKKELSKVRALESETFAQFITENLTDDKSKAIAIIDHVINGISLTPVPLDNIGNNVREADEVLRSTYGTEVEKANLLAIMLKAVDLPAEIIAVTPKYVNVDNCGLKAVKEWLVKTSLNGNERYISVKTISASLIPFQGSMYRASTLDGNILDIPDRKAVLNCTYDIKISTSQADVKTKIEADSELFPIDFQAYVKQWTGSNNAQVTNYNNGIFTIEFTTTNRISNKDEYFTYKLPEIPFSSRVLNSKRNQPLEIPYLSDVLYDYRISLSDSIELQSIPRIKTINNSVGTFDIETKTQNSSISIKKKYEIKKQLIYPNEYQLFRTLNNENEINQGKELIFEIK